MDLPNTADTHRKLYAQRKALSKWVRRYKDQSLDKREQDYVTLRDQASVRNVWAKWRTELTQRRTKRWEKDMRHRERRFVEAKEKVLVSDVLDVGCLLLCVQRNPRTPADVITALARRDSNQD